MADLPTADLKPEYGTAPATGPIASRPHLLGFLLIMAGTAVMGSLAQRHPATGSDAGQLATHGQAVQIYLVAIGMDWALFYYCWVGVHRRGGTLRTLSGGRWSSWHDVAVDVAIAVPFWVAWEAVAYAVARAVGSGDARSVTSLLPRTVGEVMLWAVVCVTAGVCEEVAFRGYLQKQFHGLTESVAVAVAAQAAVFGAAHEYQGWRSVVVISLLGVLYGAVAAWRRNLRVTMLAHAATDLWEGWLKFAVWR